MLFYMFVNADVNLLLFMNLVTNKNVLLNLDIETGHSTLSDKSQPICKSLLTTENAILSRLLVYFWYFPRRQSNNDFKGKKWSFNYEIFLKKHWRSSGIDSTVLGVMRTLPSDIQMALGAIFHYWNAICKLFAKYSRWSGIRPIMFHSKIC